MEGVDRIEFRHVDEVNTNWLVKAQLNLMALVMKRNGVDGVDLVITVKVRIKAVHHHHHFLNLPFLFNHRSPILWVDDKRPIEPFVDVPLEWSRMTVI